MIKVGRQQFKGHGGAPVIAKPTASDIPKGKERMRAWDQQKGTKRKVPEKGAKITMDREQLLFPQKNSPKESGEDKDGSEDDEEENY